MLVLLILEGGGKEEKLICRAHMAAGTRLGGLWLLRLFLQTDSTRNSVIKNISKEESKGISKKQTFKAYRIKFCLKSSYLKYIWNSMVIYFCFICQLKAQVTCSKFISPLQSKPTNCAAHALLHQEKGRKDSQAT